MEIRSIVTIRSNEDKAQKLGLVVPLHTLAVKKMAEAAKAKREALAELAEAQEATLLTDMNGTS